MWFIQFLKILPLFCIWSFIFSIQMIIYYADQLAFKILGYGNKTKHIRRGSCKNSGVCCKMIGIGLPKSWIKRKWIVNLFVGYMRIVHNFYALDAELKDMRVFRCHYQRDDNKCSIHPFRPKICREYPAATLAGHARVHKGCGFWFVEREKLGTFEEKMEEAKHKENRRTYLQNIQFLI